MVLSLPFYFTSSAVTTFFYVMSKNSKEAGLFKLDMFSYFQCASLEKRREQRAVSVYFGNELWMIYQVFVYQLF